MKTYWGRVEIQLHTLTLSIDGVSGQLKASVALPPLPIKWAGWAPESLPGNEPRSSRLQPSHCTDGYTDSKFAAYRIQRISSSVLLENTYI